MKKRIIVASIIALITVITITFAVLSRGGSHSEHDKGDSTVETAEGQSDDSQTAEGQTNDSQTTEGQSGEADDDLPPQSTVEFSSGASIYILDQDAVETDEETGINYVNNILLLFFEKGTTDEEVQRVVDSVNGTIVGALPFIDQYQVKIGAHSLPELRQICEELKENESVFEASYDLAVERSTTEFQLPNDPWSPDETVAWTEGNEEGTTSPDGSNWGLEAIEAPSAWEMNDQFGKVKIGIVDNGFDAEHEDLNENIKWVSSNNDTRNIKPDHGTHVAGIIGAEANNGIGITGIVWNCDLYLFDYMLTKSQMKKENEKIKPLWDSENAVYGGISVLVEEAFLDTAAGEKSKIVINNSSNSGPDTIADLNLEIVNADGHLASMYLCSLLHREYDFLIVQSAGNGENKGDRMSYDAVYGGEFAAIDEDNCVTVPGVSWEDIVGRVVIVGAAREEGNNNYIQWEHSNAGDRVDICAPGEAIYSTISGNRYDYKDGTSMAAPMVSGVAALVWGANEQLTGADVKKIVCDEKNTKYIVHDNPSPIHTLDNEYRLVNAPKAVEAAIHYFDDPDLPDYTAASEYWYYVEQYFPDDYERQIIRYSKDRSESEKLDILDVTVGESSKSMQYYDGKVYVSRAGGNGLRIYDENNISIYDIDLNLCEPGKDGLTLGNSPNIYTWQISNDRIYHYYLDGNDRYYLHCTDLEGKEIDYSLDLHNDPAYSSYDPEFFIHGEYIYYTEFLPEGEYGWENGSYRIWKAALDGSKEEVVYTGRKGYNLLLQDQNTEYLAFVEYKSRENSSKLLLLPVKGQNAEPISVTGDVNTASLGARFHNNELIYSIMNDGLYRYDIASGQTQKLTTQIDRFFTVLDDYCYWGFGDSTDGWKAVWYQLPSDQ